MILLSIFFSVLALYPIVAIPVLFIIYKATGGKLRFWNYVQKKRKEL